MISDQRYSICPVLSAQIPLYISAPISPECLDHLQDSSGRDIRSCDVWRLQGWEGVPQSIRALCALGDRQRKALPMASCPGFSEFSGRFPEKLTLPTLGEKQLKGFSFTLWSWQWLVCKPVSKFLLFPPCHFFHSNTNCGLPREEERRLVFCAQPSPASSLSLYYVLRLGLSWVRNRGEDESVRLLGAQITACTLHRFSSCLKTKWPPVQGESSFSPLRRFLKKYFFKWLTWTYKLWKD